jgi:S-adenosylmethionine/arginine decarboxylase-like enzyme
MKFQHLLLTIGFDWEHNISNNTWTDWLLNACDAAGANVRKTGSYSFSSDGFSAFVILAESHASIHTWPNRGFAMLDYFSCAKDPHCGKFIDYWSKRRFEIISSKILERSL